MKVGLAADHGGFEMKQQLAKLIVAGHEVVDFGNKVYDAERRLSRLCHSPRACRITRRCGTRRSIVRQRRRRFRSSQ